MTPRLPLKPLRLHELIGDHAEWTDELWDETLKYLLERVGTVEAIQMYAVLSGAAGLEDMITSPYKVDYLRRFRYYPPTLLLGSFDLVRRHGLRG